LTKTKTKPAAKTINHNQDKGEKKSKCDTLFFPEYLGISYEEIS
jgi:hypothetical protein